MKKHNPILGLMRPQSAIGGPAGLLLGAVLLGQQLNYALLLGMISLFFVHSGAMAINDYFDYKVDCINKPNRPLPAGRISPSQTLIISLLIYLTGLIIALFVSFKFFLFVLFAALLTISYSMKFQNWLIIKNLFVGIMGAISVYGIIWVYPGAIVPQKLYIIGLAILLLLLAREIMKDIEDIRGDAGYKSTIPLTIGCRPAKIIAFAILGCAFGTLFFLFINNFLANSFLVFFIPSLFLSAYSYFLSSSQAQKMIYVVIVLLLCGLLLGSI